MATTMTVDEAAQTWASEKREIKARTARLEAAAKVLKDWFHAHPKQRNYKGLIGFSEQMRTMLDNDAVKVELGDRLSEFEKSVKVESLSLLT
jgi:hypothetical protein